MYELADHPAMKSVEHLLDEVDPRGAELAELRAALYRLTVITHRQHQGILETCEDCATYLEMAGQKR